MPKIFGFIRRRHDLTFDAFSRHWATTHRAHAEKLRPWLRGYVQAHLQPGPIADVQRPADGCPTLWVDDAGSMVALAASTEFREGAFLDEPVFMEGRSSGLAVAERVIVAPPPPRPGAVKLMLFAGGSPPDGDAAWLCPTAHADGHVVNRALPGPPPDMTAGFDGVEELWWPDRAAFDADWRHARAPASLDWLDPSRFRAAFASEIEVFTPTRAT